MYVYSILVFKEQLMKFAANLKIKLRHQISVQYLQNIRKRL